MTSYALTAHDDPGALSLASTSGRWVLLASVLGSGMVAMDLTMTSIALPAIGRSFGAGIGGLQWVFAAFTITLAGLLLVAGTLGDRYGRRRVFAAGAAWFAVAALLGSLAPNTGVLIAVRGLQGVGAALIAPASLAILEASFRPQDRGKAIGAWAGFGGVAAAMGPFLGGWLVQVASWRLIYLINVPMALVVVLICRRHVPESRDPGTAGRVDVVGGVLVTLGLVGLAFGLMRGTAGGWRPDAVLALLLGAALLVSFILWERRVAAPILPLGVFRSARFSATNAVTFILYAAIGATMFLLPIELQQVAGFTPLQSGMAMLPVTAIMLALSPLSGALAARIGPGLQLTLGPVIVAGGLALFARIDAEGGYLTEVLPAVAVFALGLAATVAPLTTTAMVSAPAEHAGVASAVNNDVARTANLIAVAVVPPIAGLTGSAYLDPGLFSAGFRTAAFIAAGLCVVSGLLAALTIGFRRGGADRVAPAKAGTMLIHCGLDAPPLRSARPELTSSMGAAGS